MIRLGVAARLLGPGAPKAVGVGQHLSLWLLWIYQALQYLREHQIHVYRLPEPPSLIEIEQPAFAGLLTELQHYIAQEQLRVSLHLPPALGPGIEQPNYAAEWSRRATEAALLFALLQSKEAVIISHVGGNRTDRERTLDRAAYRISQLPALAKQYLVLEPDERCFDLMDLWKLSETSGTPIVFDLLHHQIHNRQQISIEQGIQMAFYTWPAERRPKIHISTQRTEAHLIPGQKRTAPRIIAPQAGQHADFINPFEAGAVLGYAAGLRPFDAMLEAKAADLALIRLRSDLQSYLPAVAIQIEGCHIPKAISYAES